MVSVLRFVFWGAVLGALYDVASIFLFEGRAPQMRTGQIVGDLIGFAIAWGTIAGIGAAIRNWFITHQR
jgi:hypothetical protein